MKLQKNPLQKSIGRQTSMIAKPSFKNDENDHQACNIRKFTQHRGSKPQNNSKGTPDPTAKRQQQPALKPRNTNINENKQLNLTLDSKCRNSKIPFNDPEKKGTKFIAIQQNLDQLSHILQVQKKNIETQQDVSFGYQEEQQPQQRIESVPKPTLEIKTEISHQLTQILNKQLQLNSTKEKRMIEIPKFLYGLTCENKNNLTVTNITPTSIKGNICHLEKRVGGDYFRFDFKNQKQQQLQQVLELSNKKIVENYATNIPTKNEMDIINDPLIDDKFMQVQPGKDLCEQISFLNNFTDSNQSEDYSKTEKFKEQFKVGNRVGQGAYATVRVALHLQSGKKVAIKIYEKAKLKDHSRKRGVRREIQLLQKIDHPNIVKILDTIESNNHINIILEYVGGCSLHQYLKKQNEHRLSEDVCRPLFLQIIQSIDYLHSLSICHRDIKLENILLDETYLIPKLIDFGFSTCFSLEKKVKMFCGTPSYMAPEIVSKQEYRGDKSDVWALGVVLFALLQGYFPFKGSTDQELYKRISSGEIIINNTISDSAKNLINEMLKVDPDNRITAQEILSHEWITGGANRNNKVTHLSEINLEINLRDHYQEIKEERQAKSLGRQQQEEFNKNISYVTPTSNNKQFQFDFTSSSQPKVHSTYLQSQIMKRSRQGYSPLFQSKAIMPQHDLKIGCSQQLCLNRIPNTSMTTTNAHLQQRLDKQNNGSINEDNARYFRKCVQPTADRKLSRTQQDCRQKTFSYFLNQTDEDVQANQNCTKPSLDSDVKKKNKYFKLIKVLQSLSRRGYSPQQIKLRFYDLNSDIAELYHKIQLEKKKHMLTIYPSYVPSDKSICSIRSPSNDLSKPKIIERSRVLSQGKQNAFFDDDTFKNLHIYE